MVKLPDGMARALVVVLVTILGIATLPGYSASGWQSFTHPQYGFSMSFPLEWVSTVPDSQLVAMLAVGPKVVGTIEFQINVNVVIDSIPPGTTIDEFDAVANSKLQQVFPGYTLLRTDRTQLGKYPAVLRYTTWHPRDVELYQIQLGVIVGSRVYIVTGTTLADSTHIKEEALLLQQILITFRPPSPIAPPNGS